VATPPPATRGGPKGAGESGLLAAPAAIACAVADTLAPLGISLDALPLTPEAIVAALGRARASSAREPVREAAA
jgi:carbon-monoxide dehydrogenase large subunit